MTRPIRPAIEGLLTVAAIGTLCAFGGDSTTQVSTPTTNLDARVVGGDSSTNASVAGNTGPVNISTTDFGAVDGSLKLALAGIEHANDLAKQTVASQGGLLTGALQMAGAQNQAFSGALENVKTSDVRVLIIAGLAVVGLVGVQLLKKG